MTVISYLFLIYLIFKVFWIDTLLEWWWIIAWLLAFFGFTAPIWAHDLIASIIILHDWEVEIWNVVRIKEKWILAWVKSISLSEIKLVDLVYWNSIIMRPTQFRSYWVENLTNWVMGKRSMILNCVDINISYKVELEDIEKLVFSSFDSMIEDYPLSTTERKYFPEEVNRYIEIDTFWDDAVTYKFFYYISNPFYMVKASNLLNKYLLKAQKENNIFFSTPKLINLEK